MKKKGKAFFLRSVLYLSLLCFVFAPFSQVRATEGGLGAYPDGLDDFMMAALPPPGVYFVNYATYINISNYKDMRGPGGILLKDYGETPKVRGWTAIDAPRLIYVTKTKILGGDFALHACLPIQRLEFRKADWGGLDLLAGNDTHMKTGLKNLVIGSAVAWHFSKNLHAFMALDAFLPTGAYNSQDVANTGTGYSTIMPLFGVSYISDKGFEVGAKLMYDINTTNKDTGYYSGQSFHADYIISQHFGPFAIGINGYYVKQIENDSLRNESPGFDGNKAEALAVGPAVNYMYKNMCFVAKAQFDTHVKNRPETQRYWFDFSYAF